MIPLYKPYMPELPDLDSIIHSGALAYGDYTKEFEKKLRDFFGVPYLMVTTSFHLAISVALTAMDIKIGDSVIVSPMACLASTQPYLSYGLNIHWADVDPKTGTLDPVSAEKKITENTKAIIHNHFCGYPGYIDEINEIGARHGIPVIDDGIECFGSEYHGMKIGNCGTDLTIFSLTAVRFCNCIDGGVVIFKDKDLYEKSLLIRDCGIDRKIFRDELGEISQECDISLVGYSATMSNVNGYIGIRQMDAIEDLLEKHRSQAENWRILHEEHKDLIPIYREQCNPNYWVYGLLADDKIGTIKRFREMGYFASGVHIRNDIYSVFGNHNERLPGVEEFYRRFVALPCGWWME
ncbi:DegT/DnrJ/EryC1/StrS family aminotransferase [Butyrivibrio sp. XPD2002]|uniref:DegT/DnrJ/EryC1/StrS family aminotransferase n=1 Tax=Butyrivibrio sp. XPD2002 TaxID=1280665 RepID=UPI00040D313A|nr:aminotransferase class V-fold PLP-dependent enzyme [Butyrivibrio sp. XPD2002]